MRPCSVAQQLALSVRQQFTTPRKWWPSLVYRWLLVGNAFAVFFLTFWMKESRFRLYFRNLAYRSILLYFIYIHLFIRNATPNHCHENWNETYETNRLTVASFVARAAWRTELVCILHCAGRLEFHTSWSPQVSGSNLYLSLSPSPSGLPGNVSGNLTVCGKKMKWQIYIYYILYISIIDYISKTMAHVLLIHPWKIVIIQCKPLNYQGITYSNLSWWRITQKSYVHAHDIYIYRYTLWQNNIDPAR